MKLNRSRVRATIVLIIVIIGAIFLSSCLMDKNDASALSADKSSVKTSLSVSESSSSTASETSSAETSGSTALSTTASPDTELATVSTTRRATTTAGTTKARQSSSSSRTESSAQESSENTTDKIGSLLSRINSDEQKPIAIPFEVTFSGERTTASTTEKTTKANELDFSNSAFLGNSRVLSVQNYGFAKNVYGKVGLNVKTVFTEKCEGGSVAVIDELKGKSFDNVFIMFGDNECGWSNMNVFEKDYVKVINAVRERVPKANIYVISVLPISEKKSAENEYGYNINSIKAVNEHIKKIAESEGITYIDAASSIKNSKGYLPDEASTDGCHLGKEYTKKWLTYVAKYL